MTHAALALQSHNLSGEGINLISLPEFNLPPLRDSRRPSFIESQLSEEGIDLWITYIFFDHTRTWRASPDWGSAQCRNHLRDSTNMKDDTYQAHTHSLQQGEYEVMIMTAK